MSEQTMNAEGMNPRDRAVAYLEMQQHQKSFSRRETKDIHSPHPVKDVITAKTPRKEPITDTVTAYEEMIDKFGEKGYVDVVQKFEQWRPGMYKIARGVQWTAKAADFALSAAMIFPGLVPDRLGGAWMRSHFNAVNIPGGGGSHWNPLDYSPRNLLRKGVGVAAMWRFRPIEWVVGKAAKLAGWAATRESVAPVVNNILGGGERVEKKPLPFSGIKPARA